MNRIVTPALDAPGTEIRVMRKGLRLAVRGFLALAALLTVTITATSATMLYNSAVALRDEAEAAAVNLAELLSASFADIGGISLANIARTLDATLNDQMVAQARIAAHLVAAAEEAGQDPPRIIETLDAIVANTVLDEFWITDSVGFSYLTNVRDETGELVPFRFESRSGGTAAGVDVLLAAWVGRGRRCRRDDPARAGPGDRPGGLQVRRGRRRRSGADRADRQRAGLR